VIGNKYYYYLFMPLFVSPVYLPLYHIFMTATVLLTNATHADMQLMLSTLTWDGRCVLWFALPSPKICWGEGCVSQTGVRQMSTSLSAPAGHSGPATVAQVAARHNKACTWALRSSRRRVAPFIHYYHDDGSSKFLRNVVQYQTTRYYIIIDWLIHFLPCSGESDRTLKPNFLKIHFNIILPSTPRSSKWSLFFRCFDRNCVRISHLSYTCYMLHPFTGVLSDRRNNICPL
jgi:hypothetical protein